MLLPFVRYNYLLPNLTITLFTEKAYVSRTHIIKKNISPNESYNCIIIQVSWKMFLIETY